MRIDMNPSTTQQHQEKEAYTTPGLVPQESLRDITAEPMMEYAFIPPEGGGGGGSI
jgi:hypothetical protein